MSDAMQDLGARPAAPSLSLWQMAALAAIARFAGAGECTRPKGVQSGTVQALLDLGLVAARAAERPRSRRIRRHGGAPQLLRVTDAGRAVLASGNPAAAAAQAARETLAPGVSGEAR